MALSRYQQLLRELSPWQRTMLKRWLGRHLSEQQQYLLQLLDLLDQGHAAEEIWQGVFPDQPYEARLFHRRINLLLERTQEFLLFEAFISKRSRHESGSERERLWLSLLQTMDHPDLLLATYRQLEKKLNQQALLARTDPELLRLQVEMEGALIHNFQKTNAAVIPLHLPHYHELQHIYHTQGQLLQIAELLAADASLPPQLESLRSLLLQQIRQHPDPYRPYPLLWLAFQILDLMEKETFPEFLEAWGNLWQDFVGLYEEVQSEAYALKNTYRLFQPILARWVSRPEVVRHELFQHLWNYYSWGAQSGALWVDDSLLPRTFRNLVMTLINLYQDQPEVLDGAVPRELLNWKETLSPTQQAELWPVVIGVLAFERKRYADAKEAFATMKQDQHPVYVLTARIYACMTWFELWHHQVEHDEPEKQFFEAWRELQHFLQYRTRHLSGSLHASARAFSQAIYQLFVGPSHPRSAAKIEAILAGSPQPLMHRWLTETYRMVYLGS